jgi:hypothetical protein
MVQRRRARSMGISSDTLACRVIFAYHCKKLIQCSTWFDGSCLSLLLLITAPKFSPLSRCMFFLCLLYWVGLELWFFLVIINSCWEFSWIHVLTLWSRIKTTKYQALKHVCYIYLL